jgi:chaperonin cofactor prefoldin
MPEFKRDESGAVIIKYSERELEDHIGYRLLKLEKRVEELERQLKEVVEVVLYLKGERGNGERGFG